MKLDEIEAMIKMLKEEGSERVIEFLKFERKKLLRLKAQNEEILIQNKFEDYISKIVLKENPNFSNIYFNSENAFIFSNGVSLYSLNDELIIPHELKVKMRPDASKAPLIREAGIKEIDNLLTQAEVLLGNKELVRLPSKKTSNPVIVLKSSLTSHAFSAEQINYLDYFLGNQADTFISNKNPIVYAESERGKAYVLGIKKNRK